MINKYILLFITVIFAYSDDQYGVLEINQMKNFTVKSTYATQISFLSFQGPIQFARVSEDGKLIEIQPIPGTYFFYDYLSENFSAPSVTYIAYGSKGGAIFPQYRFSTQYQQSDLQANSLMTYNNQSVKYKSENGFLIIDIPMVLQRDGSLIKQANFLINIGHQEDKELLKLSSYYYSIEERPKDYIQSGYNKMTFANYYTTFYIKIDPRDNYDYFAVICEDYDYPLGGSTFTINQMDSDSNTWIWILVTLIVVLIIIIVGWYMNHIKRKREEKEDPTNVEQTFQQFN
ncbi:unnamed protein product [Paramecium pentaurelia]|uniref:Transmembrane protein n=1 Tax=Paramecium pentaurelia TaxID=43138 RepID=A0A8S1WIP4_9CILI|nr:unnamed protein product [Paramecium pentaurelia]